MSRKLAALAVMTIATQTLMAAPKHIVGTENRIMHNDVQNAALKKAGEAVGMLILDDLTDSSASDSLSGTAQSGLIVKNTETLGEMVKRRSGKPACSSLRFAALTTVGYCSGFLIGPDTFMTAGHCVEGAGKQGQLYPLSQEKSLEGTNKAIRIYFSKGQHLKGGNKLDPKRTYTAVKMETGVLTGNIDFAILKLDRPVEGITPIEVDEAYTPARGDKLTVVGHPMGLPLIYSPDGVVAGMRQGSNYMFETSSSIFGGNSGGPIISNTTNKVVGILVQSKSMKSQEFTLSTQRGCIDYTALTPTEGTEHAGSILISAIPNYFQDGMSLLLDAFELGLTDTKLGGVAPTIGELISDDELKQIMVEQDLISLGVQAYASSGQVRTLEYLLKRATAVTADARMMAMMLLVRGQPAAYNMIRQYFPQ